MKSHESKKSVTEQELLTRLAIQEMSLKTFEKEIYENIGQILSLAKLQLGMIDPGQTPETEAKVSESKMLVGKDIADLRNLSKQLSPDEIIRRGFADAVSLELDRVGKAGLCKTECRWQGEFYRLEDASELIIFAMMQELICKILTPGNTLEFHCEITYFPIQIIISIKFNAVRVGMRSFLEEIVAANKFMTGAGVTAKEIVAVDGIDEAVIRLTIKKKS
jgi:two-component system, NarL family, sensor kinase